MMRRLLLAVFICAPLFFSCKLLESFKETAQDTGADALRFSTGNLAIKVGSIEALALLSEGNLEGGLAWHYDTSIISLIADETGAIIRGLKPGSTTVRASAGSLSATCLVRVEGQEKEARAANPYVFCDIEFLRLSAGMEKKISAGLYGVPGTNLDGFSFSIDKPSVASIQQSGNYCILRGRSEGLARVSISHTEALFSYSFLVFVGPPDENASYLSVKENTLLINRSRETERALKIYMENPPHQNWERELVYSLEGDAVEISGAGGDCLILPVKAGDSLIKVGHPALPYPVDILVRVTEDVDPVYIEGSAPVLRLSGRAPQVYSVRLIGAVEAEDTSLYTWSFAAAREGGPDAAQELLSWEIYGNEAWLSGKKSGIAALRVSHPLAENAFEALLIISDIEEEAARASTYISTTDNYLYTGLGDFSLAVNVINALPGSETALNWDVYSYAEDGSGGAVIQFIGGTGYGADKGGHTSGRRSLSVEAGSSASGYAVFQALRTGRAEIVVTHPRALYPTRITVDVDASLAEKPAAVRSRSAASTAKKRAWLTSGRTVLILEPGRSEEISIGAMNIDSYDLKDTVWACSREDIFRVAANGASASVTALCDEGEALLTVGHPLSANSLEIYLSIGERYSYKNNERPYISTEQDVVNLSFPGEDFYLRTELKGGDSAGLSFSVDNRETVSIIGSCLITPKKPGKAFLTISHADAPFDKKILIIVKGKDAEKNALPYLSSDKPLTSINAGQNGVLTVRLENADTEGGAWTWVSDAPHIADLISSSGGTALFRAYSPGLAAFTVGHTGAPNPIRLLVTVDDEAAQDTGGRPWIRTGASIVNLECGSQAALRAEIINGAPDRNLIWRLSDPSLALMETEADTAILRGVKPGTTYLHISSSLHPGAYEKTLIINVHEASLENRYISLDKSIIRLRPGEKSQKLRAILHGGSALDDRDFIWWADDPGLVLLSASNEEADVAAIGLGGISTINVSHPKAARPAEALVIVENGGGFGFPMKSKSIKEGEFCFLPISSPPLSAKQSIEYTSSHDSVVSVAGTGRVMMLSGLRSGTSEISARLIDSGAVVCESTLVVIVEGLFTESMGLNSDRQVIGLEKGRTAELRVELSGAAPSDYTDLRWESLDPGIVSVLAVNGGSAVVRAESPGAGEAQGEALIRVSHDRAGLSHEILVVVGGSSKRELLIDKTSLLLNRGDGATEISAEIINGNPKDYADITWSASKTGGQSIVSLAKSRGKSCVIIPRSAGRTMLNAQLPGGETAACLVTVQEDASIHLEASSITVNPGYEETIRYSIQPANASLSWVAQNDTNEDAARLFTFTVDEEENLVKIRGAGTGRGSLQAILTSPSGSATARLQVRVAYTYSLNFKTRGLIEAEPVGQMEIPFTVHPANMDIRPEDITYNKDAMNLLSIETDKASGEGRLVFGLIREAPRFSVEISINGKDENGNAKVFKTNQAVLLKYKKLTPVLKFDGLGSGAYSGLKNGRITLGDGEAMLFYIEMQNSNGRAVDNAETAGLKAEWKPSPNSDKVDNNLTSFKNSKGESGKISLAKEAPPPGNSSLERSYWRLSHTQDYLITKRYMRLDSRMYYQIVENYNNTRIVETEKGQGVTAWSLENIQHRLSNREWKKMIAVSPDDSVGAALSLSGITHGSINTERWVYAECRDDYCQYTSLGYTHQFKTSEPSGDFVILPALHQNAGFKNSMDLPTKSGIYQGYAGQSVKFHLSKSKVTPNDAPVSSELTNKARIYGGGCYGVLVSIAEIRWIHYSGAGQGELTGIGFVEDWTNLSGTLTVHYEAYDRAQYVAEDEFKANANWYRPAFAIKNPKNTYSEGDTWLHRGASYAGEFDLLDHSVTGRSDGKIIISYTDVEGNKHEQSVIVDIELRNSAAYSLDRWDRLPTGRFEMK